MSIIAIEEHWNSPNIAAALKALPEGRNDESVAFNDMRDHPQRLGDIGADRLAGMDAQGIGMQILSLVPPATQALAAAQAVPLARQANDRAAEAVSRYPSRFRAFATLPMSRPDAVVGELERTAKLGFVGAMVYGRSGEAPLDDPCYEPLFEAAAALGQPIFIHPQIAPRAVREAAYSGFDEMIELGLATFGWGWHLEAALATLRLILRGTFDQYPSLQVILGHWGELLLFWLDRVDSLSGIAGLERTVSDIVRSNVYITNSGMLNPAMLRHALEVTSIDRLIFSTDYPFHQPDKAAIDAFLSELPGDTEREKFTRTNAERLLLRNG
ncbi:amidohydrolase family protein [Salinisphaera hydrothermalis]|uniref:Putative amidohydrolase/decarboxylase n=1 Tax=Salinisphaera hydrothermalis (strain C41B8) TaxID=1304275 RepID=A0A084IPT9_SALHC|nr:amidohydrolase family protein [Salinisphaera hydrothermalis]KEZ78723.1 putative amidohydrolase/decarboxylase [Salinisphaera hydrothermalis C41B8]